MGISDLLEAILKRIPPPEGDKHQPLQALIFDSWYDAYLGVVALIRVKNGSIKVGDMIQFMSHNKVFEVQKIGQNRPLPEWIHELEPGQVGYIAANIKDIKDVLVGDTITHHKKPASQPLPGFKRMKPMVFAGLYPIESEDFEKLKEAVEKLSLNDSALFWEVEKSAALGLGLRMGYLGLLHMEIVQERLERHFGLNIITTAPTVVFRAYLTNGQVQEIHAAGDMPDPSRIEKIEEPFVKVAIYTPSDFVGNMIKLCQDKRGQQLSMQYVTPNRVVLEYLLPLVEIVLDFHDRLKSLSKGYASMEYEFHSFRKAILLKWIF